MRLGIYKAFKDVAMQTGNIPWMLMEGDKIGVTKSDNISREARYQHTFPNGGVAIDWMGYSRFSKCFVYMGEGYLT